MSTNEQIPVLETERLILRGHRRSDFSECAAMWADPIVVAHISGTPSTREQAWSRFLRYAGHWHHLGFGYWVVETRHDGQFVGEVGFSDYCRDVSPTFDGVPEAGWVLKTSAHGQGIATEAVRRMLVWADASLDGPSTVSLFDPENHASIAVAKKVGFGDQIMGRCAGLPTLIMQRANPRRSAG